MDGVTRKETKGSLNAGEHKALWRVPEESTLARARRLILDLLFKSCEVRPLSQFGVF